MILTPQSGKPSCLFSTTIAGRTTAGNIVLPEAFVINGQGVHLVQDGPVYAGVGAWQPYGEGGACVYKCYIAASPALRYEALLAPRNDTTIDFAITLRNLSGVAWDEWSHANVHLGFSSPEMIDPGGAITYVIDQVPGGLGAVSVASLVVIPSTGPLAGQFGFYVSKPGYPEEGNVHFPMILRRSLDSQQWAGVAVDNAATVGGNLLQGCIHANPKIGCASNGVVSVRGRIVLHEATATDVCLKAPLALYE